MRQALGELARQTGISIGTQGVLPDVWTQPCHKAANVGQALERMLRGTGTRAVALGPALWRIEPARRASLRPARARPAVLPAPGPIIVTAAKQPIALRDISRAMSVLSLSDAQTHDAQSDTATIAAGLDGLAMTALGPGRNRMFLRGVADSPFNGTSQSTVAVMIDDTRLTYAAPDPDLRLIDVDRVELLKGPQGSLYGTGALGGIYHIVSHSAQLDRFSASASAGVSAVASGGMGASGSAILNLPLTKDRIGLRLVAYGSREPGWIDTGTRKDSNTTLISGERATLGIDPGGGWRIDLSGLAQHIDARDSQYVYAPGSLSRPAQLPEPHDNDLYHAAIRTEGQIGTVHAVIVSGLSWQEVRDQLDATSGAQSLGLANPGAFIDDRHYHVWDSEIRFDGALGPIHWLAGLSFLQAGEHEERLLQPLGAGNGVTIDTSRRVATDTGLYLDASLPLTQSLTIDGGGRLFRSALDVSRASTTAQARLETTRFGITPSAALTWRPHDGRTLYLRYDSAFRQGGLDFESSGQIHAYPGDNIATIATGWREEWRDGGQLELSAFYDWWDDVQSDMLLANGLIETRTAGDAKIIGAEAALSLPISSAWRISLGATAQSAHLVRNVLGQTLADTRLPAIPDYTLRGSVERHLRLGGAQGLLRLSLRYSGPARLSFEPQLDRAMGRVLDSMIENSWTWPRTTVSFSISNPLNRAGNLFAYGNPFRAAQAQYTPQQPLTVKMTVTRHF
ncbi:MAG: TonB-dependent receptor [Sphingomonadales bacterium]|nr:TonB-dependent receptor [Sphingomonadales bacterium]MDE2170939.1 TonB-dependent receptor [Sphingomonadales bacterium]